MYRLLHLMPGVGVTLFFALVLGVSMGNAQEGKTLPYSAAFQKCDAAAASTQANVECYVAEHGLWDKRLNAAYQSLIKKFTTDDEELPLAGTPKPTARVELLRQAQRAWVAFRDADCKVETREGGSSARVTGASCVLDHTIERTLTLERLLRDE